jgi:hypothetical protein
MTSAKWWARHNECRESRQNVSGMPVHRKWQVHLKINFPASHWEIQQKVAREYWTRPTNSWNRSMKEQSNRQKQMEEQCWRFWLCKAAVLQEEEEEELHVNKQERNSLANRCVFTTFHCGKRRLWILKGYTTHKLYNNILHIYNCKQ